MTLKPAMTRGVRVHNRSKFVSHCRFPTMRILSLIWLVFIPIILADQNLAAVQLPPVFIIADADSYGEPTSSTDGLFETRFNHIKTEWMPSIPSYLRVFVTEGTNNSGYDYVNSAINLDEINSVKNRTHINSTTEYSDRGLKLYEGSRFLLPALLHIQAGFNNNIDDIFTAFELPTCLPQGYQPTDTVLLLTTGIPTLPAVALAVVINRLYGERRNAQDMHIFGSIFSAPTLPLLGRLLAYLLLLPVLLVWILQMLPLSTPPLFLTLTFCPIACIIVTFQSMLPTMMGEDCVKCLLQLCLS